MVYQGISWKSRSMSSQVCDSSRSSVSAMPLYRSLVSEYAVRWRTLDTVSLEERVSRWILLLQTWGRSDPSTIFRSHSVYSGRRSTSMRRWSGPHFFSGKWHSMGSSVRSSELSQLPSSHENWVWRGYSSRWTTPWRQVSYQISRWYESQLYPMRSICSQETSRSPSE
jgi:hypothetical protein